MASQTPNPSGSPTARAAVTLSSSSSAPRIAQHTQYSTAVRDRFSAVAA